MEENHYDALLVELECPICTNYMSPPIRQCATGHSVCEACRKKLLKCALCQGKFTESRNLSLEGLAVKMRYPCVNKPDGCDAKLSFNERDSHELRCPLKGIKCAMEKCLWVGKLEDLAAHWASKKMSSKPYRKSNVCHTKMKMESYYVNMIDAYNKLFWFKCKITNNKMFWAVQYIGNSSEAENYCYEIEIFKPGRAKKKILLTDYCQSNDLENIHLFRENGCISIGTDTVGSFVSAEQILIYYLRVNAVKDEKTWQSPIKQDVHVKNETPTKPRERSRGPPHQHFKKKSISVHRNPKQNDGFVLL